MIIFSACDVFECCQNLKNCQKKNVFECCQNTFESDFAITKLEFTLLLRKFTKPQMLSLGLYKSEKSVSYSLFNTCFLSFK